MYIYICVTTTPYGVIMGYGRGDFLSSPNSLQGCFKVKYHPHPPTRRSVAILHARHMWCAKENSRGLVREQSRRIAMCTHQDEDVAGIEKRFLCSSRKRSNKLMCCTRIKRDDITIIIIPIHNQFCGSAHLL